MAASFHCSMVSPSSPIHVWMGEESFPHWECFQFLHLFHDFAIFSPFSHLRSWIRSIFLAPYACHVVSPFLFLTRSEGEGCKISQRLPAHDAFPSQIHCNVTVNPSAVTPLKKCFTSINVYPVRPHASGLAAQITQNIFVFYSVSTVWCLKSWWVQVIKDPFKHNHSWLAGNLSFLFFYIIKNK